MDFRVSAAGGGGGRTVRGRRKSSCFKRGDLHIVEGEASTTTSGRRGTVSTESGHRRLPASNSQNATLRDEGDRSDISASTSKAPASCHPYTAGGGPYYVRGTWGTALEDGDSPIWVTGFLKGPPQMGEDIPHPTYTRNRCWTRRTTPESTGTRMKRISSGPTSSRFPEKRPTDVRDRITTISTALKRITAMTPNLIDAKEAATWKRSLYPVRAQADRRSEADLRRAGEQDRSIP